MLLNPGTILGDRYEIIEKIGSGGMAMVYRGKDKKLDRYVTVKVLREEFVGDDEFIERFRSEACSAARLSHPNIVRVYDVGEEGEISYIVMEYIHGDTLKQAIKQKAPFDSRSTLNVSIQIASALAQAHKAHIIHRDIKPQNILVGTDGVIKVTDFGIARAATASTMTTTANAAGSVHYFSPEQARGGYVDEKSDIYSLGITMFEMITGVLPFQGHNSVSIALKHISEELPDIRQYNPNCTPAIEGIIKKATMKKADERYTTIDQMLTDLIHARTDTAGGFLQAQTPVKKEVEAALTAATLAGTSVNANPGMRLSRRAAAAAELREMQEQQPKAEESTSSIVLPNKEEKEEIEEVTKAADPKEVEYIRRNKNVLLEKSGDEENLPQPVKEPMVSFERYSKKLRLSKDDNYEEEYMEAETVKTSKRPQKIRRNPRKEGSYGNEHDRNAEKKVIIAAIVTALIIIAIISVVGMKLLSGGFGGFTASEKNIEVPTFVGVPLSDAKAAAEQMGLELVEEGQDYSSYYEEGYVIYQSVGDGVKVSAGTKIGVKTSLGLTSEDMPTVVGKKENEATEKIVSLVGTSPKIEYEYNEDKEVGIVLEQSPAAGTSINAKTSITLTISKGKENQNVAVPNVMGFTEEAARKDLTAVGLVVGSVTKAESATVAEGKVMTQTLSAGQEVPSGSVVNLVISAGKAEGNGPSQNEDNNTDNNGGNTGGSGNNATTGAKSFTISAPAGVDGDIYVRIVRDDADGLFPVVDETRNSTQFPYTVTITGRGSGTVSCYIEGELQWTQNVNFSE
ncbi:serine/threonine-protein kinase PrkC [Anaerotignum neopropionicum]|uniref:non-specific serine/threonine protein kinase n=1 Tax=Anaerotignum neopropionicum TaxID=36847 RepID=A0A136WB45_9FIRM|nr:protein kinase [Anaerotignum neopropionicum]KXL51735.1 serine/threonine-protein kinase PrkC [Anaerotignum neopropionicum]